MNEQVLTERLYDIRDRVDLLRNSLGIAELDFLYDDLTKILEELE